MRSDPVVAIGISAYSLPFMHRLLVTAFLPHTAALPGLSLHLLRPARS